MQHAQENFQVEGNREVVGFLKKWLDEALKGKLNFVGLIACKSATETYCDHVGVIGTEFAANFAADNLKMQIMGNVFRRLPPAVSPTASPDQVVYNLASGPCSFDFLAWMQTAIMRMTKAGLPGPLKVAFSMGQDQHFDRCMVTDQRRIMFSGVMEPLIALMGAEYVKLPDLTNPQWPGSYTLNEAVELYKSGVPMPKLYPSADAVAMVDKFLEGQDAPIVITLRESTHWPHRNSDVAEYLKFADYLSGKGEYVLFVRDTAKAKEPLGAYPTVPPCSTEINSRVALYQRAKANVFSANGPATLCHFLPNPWFMFGPIDPSNAYPCGRPEWWLPHHGIPAGGQFPWSGPNQRIIWELDRCDKMIEAWEKYEAGEFNCPAPPNNVIMMSMDQLKAPPTWGAEEGMKALEAPPNTASREALAELDAGGGQVFSGPNAVAQVLRQAPRKRRKASANVKGNGKRQSRVGGSKTRLQAVR